MKIKKALLEIGQYLNTQQHNHYEHWGANLNFIDILLKMFDQNYDVRCEMYNRALKNMFQKIPTIRLKPLSQGRKI